MKGLLQDSPATEKKYNGYTAQELKLKTQKMPFERVVPSNAIFIVSFGDALVAIPYRYKTVKVNSSKKHSSFGTAGLTLINLREKVARPNLDALAKTLWVQKIAVGKHFLIKLALDESFDPDICVDYATNEAYPYVIAGAYVLTKK